MAAANQGLTQAMSLRHKPLIQLNAPSFEDNFRLVARAYPELPQDFLKETVLQTLVASLSDDYASFQTQAQVEERERLRQSGQLCGIGVELSFDRFNHRRLTVAGTVEGSPAQQAGLQPGDVVTAINGVSTLDLNYPELVARMMGVIGQPVQFTLNRVGAAKLLEAVMTRQMMDSREVTFGLSQETGPRIGYLHLGSFSGPVVKEVERALQSFEAQEAQAIVPDLRNNLGGSVASTIDICSMFLEPASPVFSLQERGQELKSFRSKPNPHPRWPMVVLVNQFSASAAEISAAALQQAQRAKVLGVTTFGKGSAQNYYRLSDGGTLGFTTTHYRTAAGHPINHQGLEPDLVVPMPLVRLGSPQDRQFQQALRELTLQLRAQSQPPVEVNLRCRLLQLTPVGIKNLGMRSCCGQAIAGVDHREGETLLLITSRSFERRLAGDDAKLPEIWGKSRGIHPKMLAL